MSEQPSPPTQLEMQRLTFIKQVLKTGIEQSRQAAPVAYQSILSFHDAAELMLLLCCERRDCTPPKRPDFFEYWGALESAGVRLSRRGGMKRLNNSRVALKHYSNLPNIDDIEAFRAATTAFFEDVCDAVFGITIDEIDRASMIHDDAVRTSLTDAGRALKSGDSRVSIEMTAIAFRMTVNTKTGWRSLMHFGAGRLSPFARGAVDKEAREGLEKLSDQLQEAMLVTACGGDLVGYKLLKVHGPIAIGVLSGPPVIQWMRDPVVDRDVARRCLDFVTDLVLRLQEAEAIPMPSYPGFGVTRVSPEPSAPATESEADEP